MSSMGYADKPRQPRYMIEWEEFANAGPRPEYRATLIYLPKGIEGEDEEHVWSDSSVVKHALISEAKRRQFRHWSNQRTAHYREELPLEPEA